MKFFSVAATASLALASVYAADTTTDSTVCDLTKLTPLLSDSDLTICSTSSGLVFPPAGAPSADVLKKVCTVPECASLLKKVAALNLGDCTLGALKINSQLIMPVTEACAKVAATTDTTSLTNSTTNASTTPSTSAPATTTVTTAPVTVNGEVASSGSGAEESAEETKNSSSVSATTVPSPVPTTGSASTLSMAAAGSVVVAVVIALL